MTDNPSYPEPDAAQDAMHPYANQYPMPPSGHSNIPPAAEATMRRVNDGSDMFSAANGHLQGGAEPSTPQQLAQRSLDVNQNPDQNNPDSSQRKRSKVSRACDECRRKKIRCDAESELPGTTCTACRRSGQICDFSRAPQKRGPSKGYIKDLAERVNFLEFRTGGPPAEMQYSPIVQEQPGPYPASPSDAAGTKRPYEAIQETGTYDNAYSSLQEYAAGQQRRYSDPSVREEPGAGGLPPAMGGHAPVGHMNTFTDNDKWINIYYETIHPVFPLLPQPAAHLQQNLQSVPPGLSAAFFAALEAAAVACTSANTEPSLSQAVKQLLHVQADFQLDPSILSSVVSLQALILMVIATSNSGPPSHESNRWLGLAVATATNPKLQLHRSQFARDANDLSPITTQGRRAWLILFILDRWHAASTVVPAIVSEASAKLLDSDFLLLGTPTYHMFRLSRILGHLTECFIYNTAELAVQPSKGGKLNVVLDGEIETFRESVKDLFSAVPRLHLAYLLLRLLAERNLEIHLSKTRSVANVALEIVTLLQLKSRIYSSPMLHYITALTALTLVKAVDYPINANTALALQDFRSGLDNSSYRFNNAKPGWDAVISGFIAKKLDGPNPGFGHDGNNGDRRGLEHLADAAVGKTDSANGEGGSKRTDASSIDWSVEVSQGYLNLLR